MNGISLLPSDATAMPSHMPDDMPNGMPNDALQSPVSIDSLKAREKRRKKSTAKANSTDFESFFTVKNYREEKYFTLQVIVPADVAEKIRKKIRGGSEFLLTSESGVGNLCPSIEFMPSQHSPDKISVGLWISRAIHARLVKEAKNRKFGTISDFLEYLFVQATKNVELDENDYRKIADDTERARRGDKKRKRSD